MTVVELRPGEYVETDPVEHEPGCIRIEPDSDAFEGYLLRRIKDARDEVSAEVLASMRAGRSFGDAVLDAIESLPESKTQKLRKWVEEVRATRIYAYVEYHGLYRLSYGLMLTTGGPRDAVIATESIGSHEMENLAPYWEFHDALKAIERHGRSTVPRADFEENPMVELSNKAEYDALLTAINISPEDGSWEKSGLYDFRDEPPTYSGTVKDYERESMKWEAEQVLDMMFDDDEWTEACRTLLLDN